jgi:hypothetical protein
MFLMMFCLKMMSLTLHCATGRIFIVDTVLFVESDNIEKIHIEHCDNIYEEMIRISINNPMNYYSFE